MSKSKNNGAKKAVPLRKIYFALAFSSLICGAAIYPLFRGPNLSVWRIFPMPGFWEMLRIPVNAENFIMTVFIYSGPDFLWLLSGIFLLRGIWLYEPYTQTVYVTGFIIIGISYNFGQYFGFIPGTFCLIDLLTMSGVVLTEGVIFYGFIRRRILLW